MRKYKKRNEKQNRKEQKKENNRKNVECIEENKKSGRNANIMKH